MQMLMLLNYSTSKRTIKSLRSEIKGQRIIRCPYPPAGMTSLFLVVSLRHFNTYHLSCGILLN